MLLKYISNISVDCFAELSCRSPIKSFLKKDDIVYLIDKIENNGDCWLKILYKNQIRYFYLNYSFDRCVWFFEEVE